MRRIAATVVAVLLLLPSLALADRKLSEKEILARCYAQLTGQRLSGSDALWGQLASRSATSICVNLFESVQLGNDGLLTNSQSSVHRRILKQFHDLHRDWFPQRWAFNNSFPDVYYGTVDVYDGSEPAMFITLSMFSKSTFHYQNVLRGYRSLVAIRDGSTVSNDARGSTGVLRPSRAYLGDSDASMQIPAGVIDAPLVTVQTATGYLTTSAPIVQVGALVGIQSLTNDTLSPSVWTNNFTTNPQMNAPGIVSPQNLHQSYGGGALGTIPYLLLNFGQDYSYIANGAAKLPRRVAMATYNTFMCLNGPFSRQTDVGTFLAGNGEASAAPFRKATACLRCHATLDNAALTLRNLQLGATANNIPAGFARIPAMVVSAASDAGASSSFWPASAIDGFNRTQPQGRVFFRSISGNLIDQTVQNLDGLGTVLSSTDDYYACAASRYFKYFTGINVSLFDPLDPANQIQVDGMNAKDQEYRDYVLGLGQELKATGSLKTLVNHILTSGYYKFSGFGR